MPLENIFAGPARAQTEMRPVANWLFFVWFLVGLMVLIGGLTRLTDSGLSITEWAPIAGAIPPLSQADWMIAFDKYKQIPEFRLQNAGMTLGEFKTIYWWEWGHRFLGRAIGVIFAVPLLWFVASGRVRGGLAAWLLFLLLLGGAQGFVGWIMVASGLDGERINVSHFKLAMHMGLAVFIFALLLWTAMSVWLQAGPKEKQTGLIFAFLLVMLSFCQIIAGALVAGLDAGIVFTSWPLMDGQWVPADSVPGIAGLSDPMKVQFLHRLGAYLLVLAGLVALWRVDAPRRPVAALALAVILLQAGLGIVTLVSTASVQHLWLAAAHQMGALVVLGLAVTLMHKTRYG